jgi:hypothetical protein
LLYLSPKQRHRKCAIYRGEGGAGDATADASNASALADASAAAAAVSAGDANTSAAAAEAAKLAAQVAQTAAELAETNAETAETNAEAAEAATALLLDQFDDRYLGAKAADPLFDNDGNALIDGAIYWNTVDTALRAYDLTTTDWYNTVPDTADQTAINTVATNIADVNDVADNILDVTAVADNETNIDAVAANATNINTVAGISANVTTVAGISANVTTVATNDTNINTVATDITNVNSVATNIANVNAVAGNETNINAVNANSTNINTVATNITNVNAVGTNIANVNSVAGNATNINAVAGNSTNINTVAGISGNVTTVATNNANVTTVATNIANVNTNATNIANINQNAANIVAIQNASANATAAASSATAAAGSATSASASAAAASAVALGNEPVRHSVRPSLLLDFANTKTLDPRITFTRGSTATFYDGKTVAKAEENLLLQSETFDNASWTKLSATVTANSTTAPDGTSTADSFVATASTAIHRLQQVAGVTGTTRTVSVYAKANTLNYFQIFFGGDTLAYANFDLTAGAGVLGTVGATATASIVSVGSDWYRCIVTTSSAIADNSINLTLIDSSTSGRGQSWATVGTEAIYLWGAQLEQRSSVTAYTVTTTAPITNYIPALQSAASGVARFEHNPVTGESLGLEIEEQRTNLLTYSSDYSNAAWTKANAALLSNISIAPDGSLVADKLYEDSSTNQHAVYNFSTTIAAGQHTASVFAKAGERSWMKLAITASVGVNGAFFNLSTGAIGTVESGITATITSVGNGWYRCSVTATTLSTASGGMVVYTAQSDNVFSYAGNGWNGIYIWGAQLEAGAFATSYIPTVASQVTRSADAASMTGTNLSWINNPDGTFYIESAGTLDTAARVMSYGTFGIPTFNISRASTSFTTGITAVADVITTAGYSAVTNKVAANYVGLQPTRLCVNASTVGTYSGTVKQNIGSSPIFGIGYEVYDNGNQCNTTIRKVAYYPKALSNAELQGLTTV